MGEYKEASLWMRIAYFLCLLGFILALFGWAPTATGYTEGELALFIIALIALLAAVILAVGIIYWDEFKGKIALIIFAVVTLLAGLCLLIGAAVYGDKRECGSKDIRNPITGISNCPELAIALWIFASFAEIVAGIFAILELVGVQNKVQSAE